MKQRILGFIFGWDESSKILQSFMVMRLTQDELIEKLVTFVEASKAGYEVINSQSDTI